jgi:hypothetical protein
MTAVLHMLLTVIGGRSLAEQVAQNREPRNFCKAHPAARVTILTTFIKFKQL